MVWRVAIVCVPEPFFPGGVQSERRGPPCVIMPWSGPHRKHFAPSLVVIETACKSKCTFGRSFVNRWSTFRGGTGRSNQAMKKRILIVDDERWFTNLLKYSIEAEG